MADTDAPASPGIPTRDLSLISEQYRLGAVHEAAWLADGMMNRNWRLRCEAGDFALKQIVDVPVAKVRRSLTVSAALAGHGVPACAALTTSECDALLAVEDRSYCVLPWAEGTHRFGRELSTDDAAALGRVLGQVHQALASGQTGLEKPGEAPRAKVTAPEAALAEADRFLAVIKGRTELSEFDHETVKLLQRRKHLIGEHAGARPVSETPRGPVGWTHGDFQPLNILWHEGRVSAVLDWDRLGVRPYAEEVVRTAQVTFGTAEGQLYLSLVAAFVAGYRTLVALEDQDLADAADRLWWKRMSDFWQLQFHYDKDDHGPDDLWLSGEQLLHWWTDRREVVRSAFTGHAPPPQSEA